MEFHGISDPECRESEVQITSTSLSKHFASMFAYKKIRVKKARKWLMRLSFLRRIYTVW